jgi:predicted DNA binding CopG/RHH family protein
MITRPDLPMVCHCCRADDLVGRIISGRKRPKRDQSITEGDTMRDEYDLSKMKSRRNPYGKKSKEQVTLRIRPDVVGYFKQMAEETGIPYQSLIDLYLQDCVNNQRKLDLQWITKNS